MTLAQGMTMNAKPDIPDWKLERLALGELDDHQRELLEQQVRQSPEAQARLEDLARSNREILEAYAVEDMGGEIRGRARDEV